MSFLIILQVFIEHWFIKNLCKCLIYIIIYFYSGYRTLSFVRQLIFRQKQPILAASSKSCDPGVYRRHFSHFGVTNYVLYFITHNLHPQTMNERERTKYVLTPYELLLVVDVIPIESTSPGYPYLPNVDLACTAHCQTAKQYF